METAAVTFICFLQRWQNKMYEPLLVAEWSCCCGDAWRHVVFLLCIGLRGGDELVGKKRINLCITNHIQPPRGSLRVPELFAEFEPHSH